jgi:tetratricopeptide (TPR) repeat protein
MRRLQPKTKRNLSVFGIIVGGSILFKLVMPEQQSAIFHHDDWTKLSAQGVEEMNKGNVSGAAVLFTEAATTLEDQPKNDLRHGTSLHNLAWVQAEQRHFEQAASLYQQSLAILEFNGETVMYEKVIVLNDLATVETALGHLDNAVKYLELSIALRESQGGYNNPNLAITLRRYAAVLLARGQTGESLKALQRATDIDHGNGDKWRATSKPSTYHSSSTENAA